MSNLCKFTKGIANIFIGLATISLHCSTLAADFPELKEQIDSSVRPVGVGNCTTVRTGTWLVDGGVVVALQKPKGYCTFDTLELVVDGEKVSLGAVDQTFFRVKKFGTSYYEWYRGDSGKLFFPTKRPVTAESIQGILELTCRSGNCLNEATALNLK